MKRSEVLFNIGLIFVDILMILLGFAVAYESRLHATDFIPIRWMLPIGEYIQYISYFLPVWLLVFAMLGLYNFQGIGSLFREITVSILGVSSTISLMIMIIFFNRDQFFSRLIIIYAWIFVSVFVILGRFLMRGAQRFLYRYGIGERKVVVVGHGGKVNELADWLKDNKYSGWSLVGLVDQKRQKGQKVGCGRVLGNIEQLPKIYKNNRFDEMWLAEGVKSDVRALDVLAFCYEHDLTFRFVPSLIEVVSANIETQTLAGMPLIALKETALEGWGRVMKRILDIIFSMIVLIFLWPLFVIVAICIKLDSSGPIFYASTRVGRKGNLFTIWKFRTMIQNADKMKKKLLEINEAEGPMFKIKNDPRITRVGRILRKTRIDELPQVWNVLKGEMSWIGPRPPLPDEVKQYESHHLKRLAIKSGITGPWQVTGRHDLSFDDIVKLDTYYIENWSLALDVQIFFKTILLMLTKTGR